MKLNIFNSQNIYSYHVELAMGIMRIFVKVKRYIFCGITREWCSRANDVQSIEVSAKEGRFNMSVYIGEAERNGTTETLE